ncbi:MAG: HlyD family type I secretion periplasmic adaptor subunit [Victivallales bacterium]|jgi:HlyD family secretion protein
MNKIPDEAVDFQPDALEIKNQKLPLWAQYSVFSPLILLVGALLWACIGKVDVIVHATGKLVSDKQNFIMKPLELTVIKRINVRIGDVVEPDQVLITFDPAKNIAEAERLKNELCALNAQFERLRAEFEEKTYVAQENDNSQKWQQAIYAQRQELYQQKINYYDQTLRRFDAAKKGKEDTLLKQRERLESLKKIEQMYVDLRQRQATSLKELLQVSISRMDMESTLDSLENSLIELSHQRESSISEKNSFVQGWRSTLSEEMVKIERELSSTRKAYEKNERLVSSVYLRAPCKAVVQQIADFSEGSAVREAEAMITLIPLDGTIEMEAEIRPQDIGKVAVGSKVRIKLNAYPFQKYGTLDGEIRNISEDTLQRQKPSAEQEGVSYYRARITPSGKLHGVHDSFRLIPGMEAQADIKSGKRRIIEYLIYPLIKAFDETAREP